MVTIEEALKLINDQTPVLKKEKRNLAESTGYSIAENITASFDIPSFDNSAMDGYALCGIQKEYTLVGEIAAGDNQEMNLNPGEAVRIFTGARVPECADAVMMQEKTKVEGSKLILEELPKEGQSIRRKGGELTKGQIVFEKGYTITPAGTGLIGSLGVEKLEVYKKPVINLITTGNELAKLGDEKEEGQIYESNSYALASACEQYGFSCREKKHIKDEFDAVKRGIKELLESSDVLILCGGISVGDYDYVKEGLEENGVEELFYKVFQKPGKPLYFGRRGEKFVFALPGNPASSLSCFYIYVLPFLRKLSGSNTIGLSRFPFSISHDFSNKSDRPSFLKARVEYESVEILNAQSSSMIHSMALGNALAFIDANTTLKKGDKIECYLI
ncbi:molybdopterin molybdotransferase MoeA [Mangrovivirga cuniculi]|uniref:Molybdopterin molybdenumtransferase n=1 Tax=Mangrovivirga cuniculi TaxID=2715131 RepID=A0A4D7JRW2_9BACT|nr:gephyrin-like molybdotransferase Glp [Mangrovivirga cuniculi]QCK15452.1 molybdopterin molybdenumtransferase MoeA [Mangrovivirga cuniculi]